MVENVRSNEESIDCKIKYQRKLNSFPRQKKKLSVKDIEQKKNLIKKVDCAVKILSFLLLYFCFFLCPSVVKTPFCLFYFILFPESLTVHRNCFFSQYYSRFCCCFFSIVLQETYYSYIYNLFITYFLLSLYSIQNMYIDKFNIL